MKKSNAKSVLAWVCRGTLLGTIWLSGSAFARAQVSDQRISENGALPENAAIRSIKADEANQGVATDGRFLFAIDDYRIGKYSIRTGARVAQWAGDPAIYIHINSCIVLQGELVCAMSNYPHLPMWSSVEWFDATTLRHSRSHSFGPGRGSLTWMDWHDGSWWACFANYDGPDTGVRGGEQPRTHLSTTLVRFDKNFAEKESWLFPTDILKKFGHRSSSGGRWGRDGHLYVTGHDLPEIYRLDLPEAGGRLIHRGTWPLPTNGQAFDWVQAAGATRVWTIDRQERAMVESAPGF